MGLRQRFYEYAIKHDRMPMRTKWEQAVSAVGSMYKRFYYMVGNEDRAKLSGMMEEWGLEHAEEIKERLDVTEGLRGCALALMAYHRIFGIDSSIAEESEDGLAIRVSRCMWKDKRDWTPQVCASIEAFERGLVKGIDSSIRHYYTKRRSLGDPYCEMHLKY